MSNNEVKSRTFSYRCFVNKNFQEFEPIETLTAQFHLERAEKDEVVIVEDRKTDWVELANKDVDSVGLRNILEMVRRGQVRLDTLSLKDEETGMDISGLNPMDPNAIKSAIASIPELEAKIKELQAQIEEQKTTKESEVKDNA